MTPREYRAYAKAEEDCQKQVAQERSEEWHIRLGRSITLSEAKGIKTRYSKPMHDFGQRTHIHYTFCT